MGESVEVEVSEETGRLGLLRQRISDGFDVLHWQRQRHLQTSPSLAKLYTAMSATSFAPVCAFYAAVWWVVDEAGVLWSDQEQFGEFANTVFVSAVGAVVVYACMMTVSYWVYRQLSSRDARRMRLETMAQFARLDLKTIESAGKEDLLTKAGASHHLGCGLSMVPFSLLAKVSRCAGIVALLILADWYAALMAGVAVLVLSIPSLLALLRKPRQEEEDWRKLQGRIRFLESCLKDKSSAKELRLFGLSHPFQDEYAQLSKKLEERNELRGPGDYARYIWGPMLLEFLSKTLLIGFLIMQLQSEALSPAVVTLAALCVIGLLKNVGWIRESWMGIMHVKEYVGAYDEFMAIEPEIRSDQGLPAAPKELGDGIVFDHVSLQYPAGEEPALRDISITIRPGERVALVGENGSGKTTLVKLLTRLYDPTEGVVSVGGQDLGQTDPVSWRSRIGCIFQDFVRYHGTVLENVGYAQHERMSDHDAIMVAIEEAGAQAVVERLPDGAETSVGCWFEKGAELSDGQWQKIALARAFFRNADILVLDEPTSVLDARAEYEIFQRFLQLTEGKTTVLVSHRFSTVRMADTIYVFDKGAVVENGSHQALMERKGLYAELFSMQAEGYLCAGEGPPSA